MMKRKEYEKIKQDMFMEFKLMDTTLKGIEESEEYKNNRHFNDGVRACIKILDKYVEEEN